MASEPHRLGAFRARSILRAVLPIGLMIFAALLAASTTSDRKLEPDGAPDRQADGPGVPPPILWPAPPLSKGPFFIESAEERHLRITVVARDLEQPWSIAFLPDGGMLVTERPGRLRVIRDGVLNPTPVEGVPEVHADG
ncbi:MAG TPA: PQQ-dependent sugar dehydrogenase, partial [Vicinamibacterales bacterium]